MRSSVLVVDDDLHVANVLAGTLVSRGYDARAVYDADAAMSSFRRWGPAIVVTDLEMPGADGIELCRRIRETSNVPILVVSGANDGRVEVAALDAGADDYIVKPFGTERLLARMRAALRRSGGASGTSALDVGEFQIDFFDRRVRVHGQPVRLTPKEFDLFTFMARHPNRVIAHRTLLGAVWGEASEEQPEYLRVFMGQLRKKLESDPSHPRYLVTEPWIGYRFNPTGLMQ
jgi:two-component system, OmpR family, KDP operon response regulator KdpE